MIFSNKHSTGNLSYVTKTGKELRGLFVILSMNSANDLACLNSAQVKSIISQLI